MEAKLDNVLAKSWEILQEAKQGKTGSRYITVCNFAINYPNAYTVVLRDVKSAEHQLIFYTDYRSEKVQQIKDDANLTAVYHDDVTHIQLILKGEATINYQNDIAQEHWQQSGFKGRRSYLAQQAPSSVLTEEGDGLEYLGSKNFADNDTAGFENFAVVILKVDFLEYLQLHREGNRRARFNVKPHNGWMGEWIVP
jgi:pyridoxamine 5'-phosphate oxidase